MQGPELDALEMLAVQLDMIVTEAKQAVAKAAASRSLSEIQAALQSLDETMDNIRIATLAAYEHATRGHNRPPDDPAD
jgi:hypothetical protein